ncbi:hypothetical protein OPT61_g7655 [Boeremia exigua]|uniref:Uncharacterized protein n=1 Tax=Boeremia exigua TaxID=749465 RepID=A0ACC2I1E6_9PLEO|nr:hypothetical protein OPT61_g7655 [Boeremia exigua]
MLRKQLGHTSSTLKAAFAFDLFILGGLLLSRLALQCYTFWMSSRLNRMDFNSSFNWMVVSYVNLAFDGVFLVSILASGALSILTALSLKKKNGASGSFVVWISILVLSLFGYVLISVITQSMSLAGTWDYYDSVSPIALDWISSLLKALAFITIIIIARNASWRSNTVTANTYIGSGQRV